jgi:hypothetical protein
MISMKHRVFNLGLGLGEWVTIPTTYAGGGRCKLE